MDLIYLDYNCFQRGFDDPRQIKIQLEALACEEIFKQTEAKAIRLVWSFMHEDENTLCPFFVKSELHQTGEYITLQETFNRRLKYLQRMPFIWHVHVMPNVDFF